MCKYARCSFLFCIAIFPRVLVVHGCYDILAGKTLLQLAQKGFSPRDSLTPFIALYLCIQVREKYFLSGKTAEFRRRDLRGGAMVK